MGYSVGYFLMIRFVRNDNISSFDNIILRYNINPLRQQLMCFISKTELNWTERSDSVFVFCQIVWGENLFHFF